jgi:putative endonuclease
MVDRVRTPAQVLGDAAEELVARSLMAAGWTILARNVRVGRGELDLVAIDPGPPETLVIVEVRWRAGRAFGAVEESVHHRKRRTLHEAAWRWLAESSDPPRLPIRFDLVVVEPGDARAAGRDPAEPRIRHHRAAF